MRQPIRYKANRQVERDKAYKIISENSKYDSGVITKAHISKEIIYLSTNSNLLIIELGKTFPNVFEPSNISPPAGSEDFFINEND